MPGPDWTEEDVDTLIAMSRRGVSPRDIAAHLGRPTRGVYMKRSRLGITHKQGLDVTELMKVRALGPTDAARYLDRSPGWIREKRKRLGLGRHRVDGCMALIALDRLEEGDIKAAREILRGALCMEDDG